MRVCPKCGFIDNNNSGLAWRNDRWRMYNQICRIDELPQKLRILIEMYGMAFDDEFWYVLSTKPPKTTVSKIPLWKPTKYAYEKHERYKPYDSSQTKLVEKGKG